MKREIANMGSIIPFIEKYTPESKFDAIELEICNENGKTERVFMDQVSIKTINEYPDGEKIILSIDMSSLKHLRECLTKVNFEDDDIDEEEIDDFVDEEDSNEICNSSKTDKEEYKLNINDAIKSIKKAAEVLSSAYPSEKDLCTDNWPGNKYIITPDQC